MIAVPALTPVTIPEPEPTIATPVLPLVHIPPDVPSVKVVPEPMPMEEIPAIVPAEGIDSTVITIVVKQKDVV
jgi:hypothetical protein